MTLQQLEYIVAVEKYRYFVQAADACGVTQSTLSLMVKKLEEELDVIIFDRDTHPVRLTEIGKKVVDEARLVLHHSKQLVEQTRSEKKLASGLLRIGMISTVAPVLMAPTFKYLKDFYPDIKLQAQEMRSATIIDCLKKTEIDMGILASPVNDKELLELPLFHERFFAYIVHDDQIMPAQTIQRSQLREYPLWVMQQGVRLLEKNSITPDVRYTYEEMYEGGRVGVLVQIVNENGGATIVPETHIRFFDNEVRKCLHSIVDPVPQRVISLLIRKDYIHEKLMNIIVKAVKTCVPAEFYEPTIKTEYIKL